MPGYIYLVMMADGVYKVGRTQQDYGLDLKRFKAYPRDATIVFVRECSELDVNRFETKILKTLKEELGKHPRGSEYFVGSSRFMILTINDILDADPQAEFLQTLEYGDDFWIPFDFLQVRFNTFCRVKGYPKRLLTVKSVVETREGLGECEIVRGVRYPQPNPETV